MKNTFANVLQGFSILLIVCLFQIGAKAQPATLLNKIITIDRQNSSFDDILKELEAQSGVLFSYNSNIVKSSGKYNIHFDNKPLSEVLSGFLSPLDLEYKVLNEQIIIQKKTVVPKRRYTISGYIKDVKNGEVLIGANVFVTTERLGVSSNNYGFYSLTLSEGEYEVEISYVGYKSIKQKVILKKNINSDFELDLRDELGEVVIKASTSEKASQQSQMSRMNLSIEQIKKFPAFFGEVDVIKSIKLLPGIKGGNEGNGNLYVRGGSADQNLVLLDGVPVYNVSHLFGFFSVFNPEALNSIDVYSGSFPARYGGRLSSVLDIRMKEGNNQRFSGSFGLGLISSYGMFEGPIKKGKGSFIVTGRRTYLDLLLKPLIDKGSRNNYYYFYDFNLKANYTIDPKNKIFISGYSGSDKLKIIQNETYPDSAGYSNSTDKMRWGNITALIRWNHEINEKMFNNLSLHFGQYKYFTGNRVTQAINGNSSYSNWIYYSLIQDLALKNDLDYYPNARHAIKAGLSLTGHIFEPGVSKLSYTNTPVFTEITNIKALETDAYIEDNIKVNTKISANVGVHYSNFFLSDTVFHSIQPRLNLRANLTKNLSLKMGYAYMMQYIHLLTTNNIGFPSDLWVPVTKKLLPQQSHQFSLGMSADINQGISFNIEGYYKLMNNLFEYKEGYLYSNTPGETWENKLEKGTGRSYGVEFLAQKKEGKLTGLIGYTLAWANRYFENLNSGKPFPFKYDRRHDLSSGLTYSVSKRVSLSALWVFSTSNAYTLPDGRYISANGTVIATYSSLNNFRLKPYQRMDISASFTKKCKRGVRTWNLSIYNVYAHKNPYLILQRTDESGNTKFQQLSLFSFVPSISYGFKFN